MGYFFISLTILLTVYGQLVMKWQVNLHAPAKGEVLGLAFYARMLLNVWVISAFAAAFGASLAWMGAITKLELSRAYPFMALNFLLVGLLAIPFFGETLTWQKLAGLMFIVTGLLFFTNGQ
jgi:multidrug transporter EmrE-like cation transporter